MEETEEFTSLKIYSPSSHVALSGDLVISVINSNETLDETKYKYEFKKENNQDIKQLDDNVSNELSLLR